MLFADDLVNECGQAFCCDEMTVCDPAIGGDPALCFNDEGQLDETLTGGGPLADCLQSNDCFGGFAEWCDSGIGFQDPDPDALALSQCITDNCCQPLDECTGDGTDVQGCLDCLNGEQADFDQCQAISDCSASFCGQSLVFVPICDSGLGVGSVELGSCLDANCCAEYTACVGDGSNDDIQACLDCFVADPPGPLCAPAIQCETDLCDGAGGGGGASGGAGGGGGTSGGAGGAGG